MSGNLMLVKLASENRFALIFFGQDHWCLCINFKAVFLIAKFSCCDFFFFFFCLALLNFFLLQVIFSFLLSLQFIVFFRHLVELPDETDERSETIKKN